MGRAEAGRDRRAPSGARGDRGRTRGPRAAMEDARRRASPGHAAGGRGCSTLDRVAKLVSLLGLLVAVFLAGMVATGLKIWPYRLLKDAEKGWIALRMRYLDPDWAFFPARGAGSGVVALDRGRAFPGYTLISEARPEGFTAKLVDLDGTEVQRWRASFAEVWRDGAPHIQRLGNPDRIRWHGLHVYPDGSLLLNFETEHFPYGGGLVKLDKDSRVVWKVARNTHHALKVLPDGTILAVALNWRPQGLPEADFLKPPYYEDVVLRISPEGRVLDEISIPLALRGARGLYWNGGEEQDPTHVNDVELVTPELASDFPMLRAGDLVVSMRTPNAIVAIDGRTRRAKLTLVGPWAQQHDVDLLPGGLISFYDNRGGPKECGGTRIVKLDPGTQAIVWQYDGCGDRGGGEGLDSYAWGDHQWLPNGNLLITEPFGGRAFEVKAGDPACVVWAYVNAVAPRDGKPWRGLVGEARRYPYEALPFVRRPEAAPQAAAVAPAPRPCAAAPTG